MANYDTLKNTLQSNVYQNSNNAVTGAILQNILMAFINTMGTGSNFMGFLSAANKPTGTVDGKQFYIGYNASTTALSIDLSAVGLGMLSITRSKLYVVHNIGGTWAAVDIAAGLAASITPNDGVLSFDAIGIGVRNFASFSANQAGNQSVDIPIFDARIKFIRGDNREELGSFSANAKEDVDIIIPISGGGGGGGGVSSVGLSVPTGFSVSGSPITSSGTLALTFTNGYSLPTTNKQSNWDTAYNERHTHSNISVLNGITSTKVSNWDDAVSRKYYKDGSSQQGDTLYGTCEIVKLEANSVYFCSNVDSLKIYDYDYIDSDFNSLCYKETYLIIQANSNFSVDVSGLNVYHEKDGSLGLGNITGGSTFLITVQGIIFDVRKLS